jgi:hypothetical protein
MEHGTILLPTGYDLDIRKGYALSRRIFLKGVGIACLGLAPFLQACDNAFSLGSKENETARTGSVPRATRPPIDLSAPAETRMATFALG